MKLRELTEKTANYAGRAKLGVYALPGLIYTITGLTGEAGELANKLKKVLREDEAYWELDQQKMTQHACEALTQELGDVLWYIDAIAHHLGLTLEDLTEILHAKLIYRMKNGTIKGDGDNR